MRSRKVESTSPQSVALADQLDSGPSTRRANRLNLIGLASVVANAPASSTWKLPGAMSVKAFIDCPPSTRRAVIRPPGRFTCSCPVWQAAHVMSATQSCSVSS